MTPFFNCSTLILAAGFSQRMGSPKALLKFNETDIFLTQIISQFLNFGIQNVVVVVNPQVNELLQKEHPGVYNISKICVNHYPQKGRNVSIKKGIEEITTDYCFIHNVDNPFVSDVTLKLLYNNKEKASVIIPCFKGKGGHPILINKKVLDSIIKMPENISLRDFLLQFSSLRIECQEKNISTNISTPEDYKQYFA